MSDDQHLPPRWLAQRMAYLGAGSSLLLLAHLTCQAKKLCRMPPSMKGPAPTASPGHMHPGPSQHSSFQTPLLFIRKKNRQCEE